MNELDKKLDRIFKIAAGIGAAISIPFLVWLFLSFVEVWANTSFLPVNFLDMIVR